MFNCTLPMEHFSHFAKAAIIHVNSYHMKISLHAQATQGKWNIGWEFNSSDPISATKIPHSIIFHAPVDLSTPLRTPLRWWQLQKQRYQLHPNSCWCQLVSQRSSFFVPFPCLPPRRSKEGDADRFGVCVGLRDPLGVRHNAFERTECDAPVSIRNFSPPLECLSTALRFEST